MNSKHVIVTSLVGVDLSKRARVIEGLSWLYKSWLTWNIKGEWDLIICLGPTSSALEPLIAEMFPYAKIKLVMVNPNWSLFPNSRIASAYEDKDLLEDLKKYDLVFRTDYNSMLTENLFKINSLQKVLVGSGGWKLFSSKEDYVKTFDVFREVSEEFSLNHWGFNGADDSILGPSNLVTTILSSQASLSLVLLSRDYGWNKALVHYYALDITLNAFTNNFTLHTGGLDVKPNMRSMSYLDLQIKPWHMAEDGFKILEWFEDNQSQKINKGINKQFESLAEYAFAVASYELPK